TYTYTYTYTLQALLLPARGSPLSTDRLTRQVPDQPVGVVSGIALLAYDEASAGYFCVFDHFDKVQPFCKT
ncbi:hypothetical protein, partial [Pontibacter sp. HJ8]